MKSPQTRQLEELNHKLLTCANFEIIHTDASDILKFDNGDTFNLTDIFKFANMEHLSLDISDYSLYEQQFVNSDYNHWGQQVQSKFPDLSIAEMTAIRRYTGYHYSQMNQILRGLYPYNRVDASTLRADLCNTIMCASGLAKTPDRDIPVCYRGEKLYNKREHYKRIQAAAEHGVVQLSGFVSTSVKQSEVFDYSVQFAITNLRGKYIAGLSMYPSEQEFLILPTQIQIQNYEYNSRYHKFKGALVQDLALTQQPGEEPHQESDKNFSA